MSAETPPSTAEFRPKKDKNDDDGWRKIIFALIFLLLSFGCIFCASQWALWSITNDRVDASMLSDRMADYSGGSSLAANPLNQAIATEVARDRDTLRQTPLALGVVGEIAVVPNPIPTPTPTPAPPTPTPTPVPAPTAAPTPTSAPPTPTPVPPTPTPLPPTLPPPTPIPPTPTPVPPTPTVIPPTPTTIPPTPIPPTPIPPTTPPNNPPTARDDIATTNEDTPIIIDVLSNDSDSDGTLTPSTVTVISGPANGMTTVNPATGEITYTPNPNFFGTDTFVYRVCDNDGACDTATVTVTVTGVNDPPIAVDDSATEVIAPNPITITVLVNDSDPDGDPLTVIAVSTPANGTAVINGDYTVTYTPNAGFFGTDTFTYTISDGLLTDTATVTVTVNGAPVAVDDATNTIEDLPKTINVLGNDYDMNGDSLTISGVGTPANGSVGLNGDNTITYSPAGNFNGTDTFTYTITDGYMFSTATVTVTVIPINDPPVAANDPSFSVSLSGSLNVAAPGVLANDTDIEDGPNLTAELVPPPPPSASFGLSSDGSFYYNPIATGIYTFTYIARDTLGAPSNPAIVTITVTP